MDSQSEVFTALADPHRRLALELLGSGPLRASDLAERLALPRNVTSRHLSVLRKNGLVDVQTLNADGRARLYRLNGAGLAEARSWIVRVEDHWRDNLQRFKQLAEAEAQRGSGDDGAAS